MMQDSELGPLTTIKIIQLKMADLYISQVPLLRSQVFSKGDENASTASTALRIVFVRHAQKICASDFERKARV